MPFSTPTRRAPFVAWRRLWRRHGFRFLAIGVHRGLWLLARKLLGPRHFVIQGRRLRYFLHPFVLDTERVVEIPLGQELLAGQPPETVLEVGNVLSTYQPVVHQVLDLHEKAPGVTNEDAATFSWPRRFECIVCLSTLEHVGRDEPDQDPEKAERALVNLRRHLAPAGRMLVTFPLGYHPELDEALASGRLGQTSHSYLRRESRWGTYAEIDAAETAGARYGAPFPCGNVIAVLRFASLPAAEESA